MVLVQDAEGVYRMSKYFWQYSIHYTGQDDSRAWSECELVRWYHAHYYTNRQFSAALFPLALKLPEFSIKTRDPGPAKAPCCP